MDSIFSSWENNWFECSEDYEMPRRCTHGRYEPIADRLERLIEGKQASKSSNSTIFPNFGHFAGHSFSLRFVPDGSTYSSDLPY
ncbi:hypothetical protein K0M31_006218 [Melipona bicolor]|uniref:Uncharacterized protein n=1 Tax=Melipona bicolor TaxID=60889 RepID=A0AA40FT45_9HYME|nr:hypothetical protein K0M31_006218 [Melipona bicolor]